MKLKLNPIEWFALKVGDHIVTRINLRILQSEAKVMSALTDAVARITKSVSDETVAVEAAIAAGDPDAAAAVTQLNALSDALDAVTAKFTPAAPPVSAA